MAMISSSRRHFSSLLPFSRRFSSTAASPQPPISAAIAKTRLRAEFDPDKAVSILSAVSSPSSSPASSRYAVDLTVRRLARSRRLSDVEALIEPLKSGPHGHQEPYIATLILSYGAAGMIDNALRTLEEFSKNHSVTAVSLNAALSACLRAKKPQLVPKLFAELSKKHSIDPDVVSYGILVKSHCLSKKSDLAFGALKEMEEKKIEAGTVVYTTLLDSLYKEGKLEEAERWWREMTEKGFDLDNAAYNVRAMYRALHGKPEEVVEIMKEMEAAGLKPDTITFNYLITCYCKNGRIDEAKGVYKGLGEKGCGPNAATFKNFLYFLCENGDFNTGLEVYGDSVKHNKIPDFRTMTRLVEGLVKGSRVEEAKAVIDGVKKKFPANLVHGWKKLERKLGLSKDEEAVTPVEVA